MRDYVPGSPFDQVPKPSFRDRVRQFSWRHPVTWILYNLRRVAMGKQLIFLDYPFQPFARWGYGKPAHARLASLFAGDRARYAGLLRGFLAFQEQLARIPAEANDNRTPQWRNRWLPPPDAAALYCLLAQHKPKRYIEIGSGNSTKFARRAIQDHGLATTITSIDPHPRAEIDGLCDHVIRKPLQDVSLELFGELQPGDFFFLDSSHVVLTNSDVTVALLEVLPALPAGVFVQVHDILLPYDYPPGWAFRSYTEQYLLAFALLEGASRLEVLLPNAYVAGDAELAGILRPLWERLGIAAEAATGLSFWMLTR